MAITIDNFTNITNNALDFYIRGEALAQNLMEKPLVRILEGKKKTFPSGKEFISKPVQGAWMSDDAAFFKGYQHDDQVAYQHPDNTLRAKYPWKEVHAGINFTMTELKQDGISVVDSLSGDKTTRHTGRDLTVLTGLLDNKLTDMGESWAIKFNEMLWKDGTQDANVTPGLLSILTDTPEAGTTGYLNRATYAWWRHRALVGAGKITSDPATQALTRKLRSEVRQLRKYGGKPNRILAGSDFIDALENEVQAKGNYTDMGFTSTGKTDIGMANISMRGVGVVEYDPTLDVLGLSKRAYIFDDNQIQLMPMEGEDKVSHSPARPYDQYVLLKSMTWTGGLVCWKLNSSGVYEVA